VRPPVVIIDLDGTLLDTRRRHHAAYCQAIATLGGQPLALAPYWTAKRRGESTSRLVARATGRAPDAKTEQRFSAVFAAFIEAPAALQSDSLQRGVRRALSRIARHGADAVLVTQRRDEAALRRQLQDLGLDRNFAAVIATAGAPKHAALSPDIRKRATIWIGDTEEDLASARRLGVPICLVANGIRSRRMLAALQPDYLAASFGAAVSHWTRA
jgi:phosphoglycolate phosphatase-like HAD superfamily hydrolase